VAFDTKYRPRTYNEVLGQGTTVSVLKRYVAEGRGFHQSYVFSGQHGSGKTTLARILARALLCESPVEGEPCDKCSSCVTLLNGESHECFEEVDAATRSGKEDLSRIVEDASYSTFSGKKRIWLLDESHRLSKNALDVLLKSMEDNVPGSEDKILVLIFCTTEPDKMVSTIFSRCAPAFVIRPTSEEDIAGRLAEVCQGEGIEYEKEALVSLAETSRSHIRDALKSLEGVSVASGGKVTNSAVRSYFKFDTNDRVLELLGSILARERSKALSVAEKVCQALGPKVAYERLSEASMAVYRANLGIPQTRSAWDKSVVDSLSQGSAGKESLEVAKFFSCPPNRVSVSSFVLDCAGFKSQTVVVQNHTPDPPREEKKDTPPPPSQKAAPEVVSEPTVNSGGVYINPKGVKHSGQENGGYNGSHEPRQKSGSSLDRETFKKLVEVHIGGRTLECLQRKIHG
jgi:DNA polymerase III subunit gamma/tau